MPGTINLGLLTPPLITNEQVPPRAWSKSIYRDGTRPDQGGGVITDEQWLTILRTEGLGTKDPAINLNDLDSIFTYLGSFRIPWFSVPAIDNAGSKEMRSICYRAPNGTNGTYGSMFIGAREGSIAEVQIPALSTDPNYLNLNPSTILQNFVKVVDLAPSGNANINDRIGWMRFDNEKLYISAHNYYDGDAQNTQNIMVCTTPSDLANGTYWGFIDAYPNDWGARYIMTVPAAWQAAIGHTHLVGVTPELAIVSRSSNGHSLIGLDLSSITNVTASLTNTVWSHYPNTNSIGGYSEFNNQIRDYYAPLAWATLNGQYSLADFYDPNVSFDAERIYNWGGINSTNLSAFSALPIDQTSRINTLNGFALPDSSLRKHALILNTSGCGCGFIIPGTDTVCFLGWVSGARYGTVYKSYNIEQGPSGPLGGGFGPISSGDSDPFIWLMNLNDVINRVNAYDPQYYYYGPWNNTFNIDKTKNIIGGYFDEASNKLYLMTSWYPDGVYERQNVISVYQIGMV